MSAADLRALPEHRRDWKGARRALRTLIRDPERTDAVFDLIEALDRPPNADELATTRAIPACARLLADRPNLVAALSDREALARLPEGSFGRAYLDFVERNGISAEGLVAADEDRDRAAEDAMDPDGEYLSARGRDCHDLWHVLTGYGTDEAGEVSVLAFTYGQYPSLGIGLIVLAGAVLGPKTPTFVWERYLFRCWRRGRRAALEFARYEDWLPLPLAEARRRAGVEPPEIAHPGGVLAGTRETGAAAPVAAG